jgi:membrane protein YqaA with SNARE-associated domain
MSVKSKLARQAVKTTAKHTAKGAASKATRRPFRTATLLALGASLGAIVGWLIGRSGGGDQPDPTAQAPASPGAASHTNNSTERASETGAVS